MADSRNQVGALCYRLTGKKLLRILLITSRDTGRWVIPKGWHEDGFTEHHSAALEALEEAGVVGRICSKSIGMYEYLKVENSGDRKLDVVVFPMRVKKQRERWKERKERKRRWFSVTAAAKRVSEPELAAMIRGLAEHLKQ